MRSRFDNYCSGHSCTACGGSGGRWTDDGWWKACSSCEGSGLKGGRSHARRLIALRESNRAYWDAPMSYGAP